VGTEEAFGVVLRKLRQERKLSQEELAFESGLNRQFVSLLELGQRFPSLETLYKLSAGLGLRGSDLLVRLENHERPTARTRRRR
jgi:transcriptional regulator with XRE-family HTH domain